MRFWLTVLLLGAGVHLPVMSEHTPPQAERMETVSVGTARPILAAIQELRSRHGWVVTYEDPAYAFGDLRATPSSRGVLFFQYPAAGAVEPRAVLPALLQTYHDAGFSERFELVETGNGFRDERQGPIFHVVPEGTGSATGQLLPMSSRLDARIWLPAADRLTMQMVEAVLQAAGDATGTRIGLASAPINSFINTMTSDGASNEVARDVLVRTLRATGRRDLTWDLACGQDCLFNVSVVHHERFERDVHTPNWAPPQIPR